MNLNKQTKPQEKSCLGSKTKRIRCRLRVYASSWFLHIQDHTYDAITETIPNAFRI